MPLRRSAAFVVSDRTYREFDSSHQERKNASDAAHKNANLEFAGCLPFVQREELPGSHCAFDEFFGGTKARKGLVAIGALGSEWTSDYRDSGSESSTSRRNGGHYTVPDQFLYEPIS